MAMRLFVGSDGLCHATRLHDDVSLCMNFRGNSKSATKLTCPSCLQRIEETIAERDRLHFHLEAYANMFSSILDVARIPYRKKGSPKQQRNKDGSYEFIPHNTTDNVRTFTMLKERLKKEKKWSSHKHGGPTKFLDAGCGIGNVMLTAQACGLAQTVHGLELFDDTIEQARAFLGLTEDHKNDSWSDGRSYTMFKVFKRDIMTFKLYNRYDIIYFYCPFCNSEMQRELEEHIENSMKIGAVLIRRRRKKPGLSTDPRFKQLEMEGSYASVLMKIKR